jgi:hypothetical protein
LPCINGSDPIESVQAVLEGSRASGLLIVGKFTLPAIGALKFVIF